MARWFVDRLPQRGIPSVSLRRLLPEAQFVGCADLPVFGCTDDHRRLEPGQVFVAARDARPGYDGHLFVREAIERGAAGVVVERTCPDAGELQVVVRDGPAAHARICQALAGDPSQRLATIGVAGSFGQTVTSLMVRSIIEAAGDRCGLIGSLGYCDGSSTKALGPSFEPVAVASHSLGSNALAAQSRRIHELRSFTPDAASVAALLSEMVKMRCAGSVLEVSAEGLLRRCFDGVTFHAAVATDVSVPAGFPTEAVAEQRRAFARVFRQVVPGGVTVVNADDANAEVLGGVNLGARRVAFALEPFAVARGPVDVSGRLERIDGSGTRMRLRGFSRELELHVPLVGVRIATCALAAAALAWAMEIDPSDVVSGLESVQTIGGHLESVVEGQDFDVRIDAAQTPHSLTEALIALRAISAGRVHVVLSTEGQGDRAARRLLAAAAESAADRVIVTLSNPRTEDPNQILDDLLAGFRQPGKVRVEPDRQTAIETTLAQARPGDAVLIAGKGRQTYQIFARSVIPFDDRVVAGDWLRTHQASARQRSA